MRETEDEIAHIEQRLAALDAMRAAAERQVAASQDLVMGAQHDFYDYDRVHEARHALKAALSDYDHARWTSWTASRRAKGAPGPTCTGRPFT